MQFTIDEAAKTTNLKSQVVSIPNSFSSISKRDIDVEACYCTDNFSKNVIMEIWNKQHPIIHTWLLLSSISICFLSALFFVFQ